MAKTRLTTKLREVLIEKILQDAENVSDPSEEIRSYIQKRAISELPTLLRNSSYLEFLGIEYLNYPFRCYVKNRLFKPTNEDRAYAEELIKVYEDSRSARSGVKRELHAALGRIRYVEDVTKTYPEFEKYLPKPDETLINLPAVQVLNSLNNLGWPKDGKRDTVSESQQIEG